MPYDMRLCEFVDSLGNICDLAYELAEIELRTRVDKRTVISTAPSADDKMHYSPRYDGAIQGVHAATRSSRSEDFD